MTAEIIDLQAYRAKKQAERDEQGGLFWVFNEDERRRREDFERNGSHRYTDDWSECPF